MNTRSKNGRKMFLSLLVGLVGIGLMGPETGAAKILEEEGAYRLSNQDLEMALDKKSVEVTGLKSLNPEVILPAISGRVLITDAKTEKPVLFSPAAGWSSPAPGWKGQDDYLSFSTPGTNTPLNLSQKITTFSGHIEWQVELENRTDARAEFMVTLSLSFPAPAGWTYWDGHSTHDNPVRDFERAQTAWTFPMAGIYAGQWGISLGLNPRQLLDLISGVRKETDSRRSFYYATKVTLLPRQKVPVTFVLYTFKPDYGFRSALQRYYDIYPDVFTARTDISPLLQKAGFSSLDYTSLPDFNDENARRLLLEKSRRYYGTWDWGGRGGQTIMRHGDYYGHPEKWPEWYPDRAAQSKRRNQLYTHGLDEVAVGHYIWLPGAEAGLLEKFYPESIVRDKDGQPVIGYIQPVAGRDERWYSINLFVDGQPNKLAQDTMADMKLLTKELNLAGFSFDSCAGFDQARFMDYVHSLHNDRYRLGVLANGGEYVTVTRTDVLLLERTPFGDEDSYQWPLRYLAGRKMAGYWWPYHITKVVDDIRSMSPEEIKETYFRLRDAAILTCFQKGNLPHFASANGLPTMYRYFPIFLEVLRAGWEPVVAMKLQPEDESIWLARYGRNIGAFLFAGNSTRETKEVSVRIENRFLGEYSCLFSLYAGTPIPQMLRGKDTLLTLKIPGGSPVILKSWAGIQPQGEVAASVKAVAGVNRSGLTVDLECSQDFTTPFFLRLPEDTAISKITLNGKAQAWQPKKEEWERSFQGELKKGKNRLEVEYASLIFADDEAQLLDFPFVKEGKPVCALALTNPQDKDQKYVAALLQSYFRFYYQKKENKEVLLPITNVSGAAGTDAKVVIEIKAGVSPGVKREGNSLYLRAETGDQAKDIARKFMRVLDRKYVWLPVLGESYAVEPEFWGPLMKDKGLLGTILE